MALIFDGGTAAMTEAINQTFDKGPTIAAGIGHFDLGHTGDAKASEGVLSRRDHLWGRDVGYPRYGFGNADGENMARLELMAQSRIGKSQISGHRLDPGFMPALQHPDRRVDVVNQGHHIGGIIGVAFGQMQPEDKTGGHFGDDPRLAAELDRTIALAFDNGGNTSIIGIDDFGVW